MAGSPDPYEELGVPPRASAEVVETAYRLLLRTLGPSGITPNSARLARVEAAYAKLRSEAARQTASDLSAAAQYEPTLRPAPAAQPRTITQPRAAESFSQPGRRQGDRASMGLSWAPRVAPRRPWRSMAALAAVVIGVATAGLVWAQLASPQPTAFRAPTVSPSFFSLFAPTESPDNGTPVVRNATTPGPLPPTPPPPSTGTLFRVPSEMGYGDYSSTVPEGNTCIVWRNDVPFLTARAGAPVVITVSTTWETFRSSGCAPWTLVRLATTPTARPLTPTPGRLPSGPPPPTTGTLLRVPSEMAYGDYSATVAEDAACIVWRNEAPFLNARAGAPVLVTVSPTWETFRSFGCGPWTVVRLAPTPPPAPPIQASPAAAEVVLRVPADLPTGNYLLAPSGAGNCFVWRDDVLFVTVRASTQATVTVSSTWRTLGYSGCTPPVRAGS